MPQRDRALSRRSLLCGAAGVGLSLRSTASRADEEAKASSDYDPELDLRNLKLADLTEAGRRFLLVTPRYQDADRPIPLVLFLHGLGETVDERLGAYAWLEKYGLGSAWQRLKRPPIAPTSKRGEWTSARLDEVNAELAARPFRGFAMVTPFMPNPHGAADHDAYAKWIAESLLPRCRREAHVRADAEHTLLCGVSLGGHVALEVLVRLPRTFGGFAGVQTAIGEWAADGYADKIAKMTPKRLFLLTSTQDHWKKSSEALAAALSARKVAVDTRTVPGPHDQPWLREAGTIETLHWLDRLDSEPLR